MRRFQSIFCRIQNTTSWYSSSKLAWILISCPDYLDYHPELLRAHYVDQLLSSEHRRATCLLRNNMLPLNGVVRYNKPIVNPYCEQCDMCQIEDICHFLFVCPRYTNLRQKLIPQYYCRFPSSLKVQLLCCNTNPSTIFKLGRFIDECLMIKNKQS